MVRDRLVELKEKSNESRNNSKIKNTSIQIEENPLENIYKDSKQIDHGIERVLKNVELCRCYMREINEMPYRDKVLSEKLNEVFRQNIGIIQNVNTKLQQFENHIKISQKTNSALGRIEMIQFTTLRTRFRECIQKNSEEMEAFKTMKISTYKAQLKVKGIEMDEQELSELFNSEEPLQIFTDNHLIETSEAHRLLSEAEELNEQLLKIEILLGEVRDLFVQLSVLVYEQQELIDVVEFQAQQAVDYVGKTPKILKEAEDKKRKCLKIKIFLLIFIVVVVFIVALSWF